MCARAVALWCALVVAVSARAAAYTVDCNHEYTDCDTELSKITGEEDDVLAHRPPQREVTSEAPLTTSLPPTRSTPTTEIMIENKTEPEPKPLTEVTEITEVTTPEIKPRARLLNLNVDELQNFAIALHNETNAKGQKKHLTDLSDVNLDGDDDEEPRMIPVEHKHKDMPEKFYANLQAPFHPLMTAERGSEEMDTCKENEVTYKIGERMDRGCEETCECLAGGIFDCSPRCKHPYIRRGRRLNDPLCFESPVDDCCSIIACATGNGDNMKVAKVEMCRYGNETHPVGTKWHIGCEQTCSCEPKSIVTCKPRCSPLAVSDKCINVQDPNDACCEVQVCDVSHDVHEEPENATTSTTSTTTELIKGFEDYEEQAEHIRSRPLVLTEPIGSVKVLQNNSVQVNLMHLNQSEDPIHLLLSSDGGKSFSDVELKYSNLILNLEGGKDYILKTKETGTKFNFTITTSDSYNGTPLTNEVPNEDLHNVSKVGCYQDGQFYAVGEEFHIGCTELCECVGSDKRECAALACPSHVGLELVSKGCVRWAPTPPAAPPNCCPRSARCLSDGTCHYKGVAVPNWSEVPITLTGCEQRCFCENGDLDCQEVCSPLPPIPPQTLRCPPNHRPAAVNISDEDCCKQWGCLPNAGNGSSFQTYSMPILGEVMNYVTPVAPDVPTLAPVIPTPPITTSPVDFYRHLSPVKSLPKYLKTVFPVPVTVVPQYAVEIPPNAPQPQLQGDNITVFTLDDIDAPFKTIHPEPPLVGSHDNNWQVQHRKPEPPKITDPFRKSHTSFNQASHSHPEKHLNLITLDKKMHEFFIRPSGTQRPPPQQLEAQKVPMKSVYEPVRKIPISKIDNNNLNYFLPSVDRRPMLESTYSDHRIETKSNDKPEALIHVQNLFQPVLNNKSAEYHVPRVIQPQINARDQSTFRKHVTILKTKDMKIPKPTELYHDALWDEDSKAHVLTKEPNPYETVLLRPVSNSKDVASSYNQNIKSTHVGGKTYTALDLEHLLNQMEVESVVNKNLGRSADKGQDAAAGQQSSDDPPHQSFLPTIPPEVHFPRDDIPDYDQNNIHRPINPIEPALHGLPPGLTLPPSYGDTNKKLSVISLQADSPTSVKMLFGLPTVLVGLRGSVDLRYTDKADEDVSHWYSQVFAPADEVLTTPRLEFRLTGLKPATTYKIRGKLYLHNLPVEPESEIYTIRTQEEATTTTSSVEEKRREIDSRLTVVDVNDTTAHVSWRRFAEDELQFIDALQVRYRPMGTPIYSMTELLHHSRSTAELHDLRPGSRYEASLVLVPPPKATTELTDPGRIEFTTAPYVDPYNWTVSIEARTVGSEAAEVWWRGIPAPAERWVRVYRGAHACGARRERDAFRLAARDLPPAITLTGLQPDTKCRVWLEMFLTNGKVKTSNVLEINTKSLDSPEPIDNEIEASSVAGRHRGDYYGALVGVGAVAALGALTSLLLLLVVLRRHRPRSVPITTVPSAPRESSLPPYDNPAYKLELQQETMDL